MAANDIKVTQLVANLSLAKLTNMLTFYPTADKSYTREYEDSQYNYGDTINIRRQNHFVVGDGRVASPQPLLEDTIPLTIAHQYNTLQEYSTRELSLDLDPQMKFYRERVIDPAMAHIVNQIEVGMWEDAKSQLNFAVGTPGTPINTWAAIQSARTKMLKQGMPIADKSYCALCPDDGGAIRSALQNNFNTTLNSEISLRSQLGNLAGFDMFDNQAISTHTTGSAAGALVVDATLTSGTTLTLSGATASATNVLRKGDVITVAGSNAVNPMNYSDTGNLMQFVVQEDADADGSGDVSVSIYPAVVSDLSSPRRNVTAPLTSGEAVSVLGVTSPGTPTTYRVNLAYTPRAIAVLAPKMIQKDVSYSAIATDPDTGISIRVERQGDLRNDVNDMRFDVLIGWRWFWEYGLKLVA